MSTPARLSSVAAIVLASGIRRFIDPEAKLKYVQAKGYSPAPGELRFDLFAVEFTHEGDLCTFEVLLARLGGGDPALRYIADMIHDIDLRDAKFGRQETTAAGKTMLDAFHRAQQQRARK
jgi:hypothetical protein